MTNCRIAFFYPREEIFATAGGGQKESKAALESLRFAT